jgi:hypothetical protein
MRTLTIESDLRVDMVVPVIAKTITVYSLDRSKVADITVGVASGGERLIYVSINAWKNPPLEWRGKAWRASTEHVASAFFAFDGDGAEEATVVLNRHGFLAQVTTFHKA